MSALLFIADKRETIERIKFVMALRLARAKPDIYRKKMDEWAKHAEFDLYWED
jgi:hypothetical protein